MVTQPIANDAATDIFAELDARSIALLLDVDGTLIDIGPSPNEVHVADDLRQSLARLSLNSALDLGHGAAALLC
jgi:trehalose-6-phosphatase